MIDVLLTVDAIDDEDERDCIGRIYGQYAVRIKAYAMKMLGNEADAEDALSITFEKIIRYRSRFTGIDEHLIKGRVYLIARCTCLDLLDRRRVRERLSVNSVSEDPDDEKQKTEIADDFSVEDGMLRKESADLLYRALSALDSPAKEIVIMRYMEDIPGAVVADLLSMNESTVRTILHRSLKKLKKELEGYYNGKE